MTTAELHTVADNAADFLKRAIRAEDEDILKAIAEAATSAELLGKDAPKTPLGLTIVLNPDNTVRFRFSYTVRRCIEETGSAHKEP